MRIAMDIREACKDSPTGKGQWLRGLLSELLRRGIPFLGYSDVDLPSSFHGSSLECVVFPMHGVRWHRAVARRLLREREADVYLSPTSFIVPFLLGTKFPCVPVVHDLIAFTDRSHERRATWIERLTLPRAMRSASHVVTVSATTKHVLLERFPSLSGDRVTPVFAGPSAARATEQRPDGRTILCVGTLSLRKNQRSLIEAFTRLPEHLRAQSRLVLAGGRGWRDDAIVRLAGETPGVEWLGYVDDPTYRTLLSSCTVLALPSFDEGFGLQVLDALQSGVPVLTSGRGALREVCGNAAHYVDPEDIASIASGLELLLTNERLRFDLRERALEQAKQYSWVRTADLLLEALGEALC
jgi:glycosyltransferase involved in cell wall biosynthesis